MALLGSDSAIGASSSKSLVSSWMKDPVLLAMKVYPPTMLRPGRVCREASNKIVNTGDVGSFYSPGFHLILNRATVLLFFL